MFKNAYQSGFLSILYSIGSKPLQIWDKNSMGILYRSTERAYQEANRPGYPVIGLGDHGHQCDHGFHHLPS